MGWISGKKNPTVAKPWLACAGKSFDFFWKYQQNFWQNWKQKVSPDQSRTASALASSSHSAGPRWVQDSTRTFAFFLNSVLGNIKQLKSEKATKLRVESVWKPGQANTIPPPIQISPMQGAWGQIQIQCRVLETLFFFSIQICPMQGAWDRGEGGARVGGCQQAGENFFTSHPFSIF